MALKIIQNEFININDILIRKSKERLVYFAVPFLIFYIVMVMRLLDLTIMYEDDLSSNFNHHLKYQRPIILDRNNTILATNLFTASMFANPNKVTDPKNTAKKIVSILGNISYSHVYGLLTTKRNFVWIKRHITPKEHLELKALGLPGINFQNDEKRVYPHGNLFAHILGYVDMDGNGLSGIERYVNNLTNNEKAIKLSVDLRVQNIVRNELTAAIDQYNALSGVGIVLDAKNGEVISMVSIPDFDLNNQSHARDIQKFNRASLATYEMGSIFKLFTVASALDSGQVKLEDTFDVSEPLTIGQFTVNDFHKSRKPQLTIQEIFAQSSNIGIAKVAIKSGKDIQMEYLKRFNLLSALNIEIPEKSIPILPKRWSDSTIVTISYGYGIAVTPLHVTQAAAALVNGGIMNPATLISNNDNNRPFSKLASGKQALEIHGVETYNNIVIHEDLNLGAITQLSKGIECQKKSTSVQRVISPTTSNNIRKLLRIAVKKGTGKKADAYGYLVGGKTGSAEKVINGKYQKDANISSFIGVFPISNPKYVILILVDEPHSNKITGGVVAAPIVKNIINKIAPILNVAPDKQL